MKILFTALTYYPQIDGVAIVTKYLAEGLAKLGHEVFVATTQKNDSDKEEYINNVKVYRFNIYFKKFKGYRGEIDKYKKFIENFDCDILINECTQCATTDLILKSLKKIKAKKILHVHGFSGLTIKLFKKSGSIKNKAGKIYNYIKGKIYYAKLMKYLKFYNKILCLSKTDNGKEYIEKHTNIKPDILENAAEDIFFNTDNKDMKIVNKYLKDKNNSYIISVANYVPVKNQEMILKMFYKCEIDNCELILIGREKTYYYERLIKLNNKLKRKYNKENINILVGIDRKEIPTLISNAKLYIVSSLSEQYSISIIEAMASSIPFISTNVGNASILPGGKIVKTIKEMENETKYILNNEDYRKSLGEKGFKYASEHCKIDQAVKKMNDFCNKL